MSVMMRDSQNTPRARRLRIALVSLPIVLLALGDFATAEPSAPFARVFAPGVISEPYIDTAPTFMPDGKTVYFQHSNGVRAVIMVSHMDAEGWSLPHPVPFSGRWNDLEPALSPDGTYMIFASARPVRDGGAVLDGEWGGHRWPGQGGNLWRVNRHGNDWGEPVRLPDSINAGSSVFEPSLSRSGTLYFMQPDPISGKFHLFRAEVDGTGYKAPEPLSFTDAAFTDTDPAVAADESFIVFGSRRAPSEQLSLYVAFRHGTGWGAPVRLPDSVNANAPLMDAHLSSDEKTLYFSRDRMIWAIPFEDILAQARSRYVGEHAAAGAYGDRGDKSPATPGFRRVGQTRDRGDIARRGRVAGSQERRVVWDADTGPDRSMGCADEQLERGTLLTPKSIRTSEDRPQ